MAVFKSRCIFSLQHVFLYITVIVVQKKYNGILGVVQQVSLKLGHVLNLVSAFSQLCHRKRTVIRFSPMMHSQ